MVIKVQINNYVFNYCLDGDANQPNILFLHGFMGDRLEFKQAIALLSQQFYCIAIDLLGHGQTECINPEINQNPEQHDLYTIQSVANYIIKFLDLLQIKRTSLVGYSMGGRLALYLTIHFPQYFERVVLESASAGLQTIGERCDRVEKDIQIAAQLEICDFKIFLDNWYQQPIFANLRSHPNFGQMLRQRLDNSPLQLANSLRNLSLGQQPSLWKNLADNQIPLLLLVGELDSKFVEINQKIHQLSKSSQLEIILDCGHNIHFEKPELFNVKVQDFLIF
jgi:2-succinyl-6-hydroxy-2,4-cyclohexadiene-1-carboxylate synthase